MNGFQVFGQMLILFLLMLTGFYVYKKGIINEISYAHISKLVVDVLNPALILSGVLAKEVAVSRISLLYTALLAAIMYLLLILAAPLLNRLLKVPEKDAGIYRLMTIFANVGFIGIPVVSSVYGKGSIIYVSIFILMYNILMYTYGIYTLTRGTSVISGDKNPFLRLVNPGVISCLLALLVLFCNLHFPPFISGAIDYLGSAAVPLSMIITGASLATANFKSLFLDKRLYLFSFIKLLLVPALVTFCLSLFSLPIPDMLLGITVFMIAMPIGSVPIMLAAEYGIDGTTCSRGVLITTLLSVLTIPAISFLFQMLFTK